MVWGLLSLWTLIGVWMVARAIDWYPAYLGLLATDLRAKEADGTGRHAQTGDGQTIAPAIASAHSCARTSADALPDNAALLREFFAQAPARRWPTLLGAALAVGVALWAINDAGASLRAACWMVLGWSLIVLAFVDALTLLLPDTLTLPLLWLGLVLQLFPATRSFGPTAALWGVVAGYVPLWLLAKAYRGLRGRDGLGMGDLKLLAALGAWSGAALLPGVIFLAAVLALFGMVSVRTIGRQIDFPIDFTLAFPFGPWIIMAWFICTATGFMIYAA